MESRVQFVEIFRADAGDLGGELQVDLAVGRYARESG